MSKKGKWSLRLSGIACIGLLMLGLSGCDWTSGGGVDTWVDAGYDWANFSGNYRAPDGKVLVRQFGVETNNIGTITVTNEARHHVIGTGDGVTTEFSGSISAAPIPGTLTIIVGSYRFTDSASNDGLGTFNLAVTPADGSSGSINYDARLWTLKFPAPLDAGARISATYLYRVTEEHAGQGNHGDPIYSFVVHHQGNQLQLVDSNGTVYKGSIGAMQTTAGRDYDPTDETATRPTSGNVYAQFHVTGHSQGYEVHITGTLQGSLSGTTAGGGNSMINRTMQATFVEVGGMEADITAVTAN